MDVYTEVKSILSDMGVPERDIVPAASLVGHLGLDSLELMELAMSMEEAFGVQVSDESIEPDATVGDVVLMIRRLQGE